MGKYDSKTGSIEATRAWRCGVVVALAVLLPMARPAGAESRPAENHRDAVIATILGYHELDDAPTHATRPRRGATANTPAEQRRYTVTIATFIEQLDYLQNNGYNVISLSTLVDYMTGRRSSIPPRAVVITFDDGWLCVFTNAMPILSKRGLPFTIFVHPSFVSRGAHAVTWSQVERMAKTTGIEVGSHSFSHPFLTRAGNPEAAAGDYAEFLRTELLNSRKIIRQKTRKNARYFAYPFGDLDAEVVQAVGTYGYEAAVTVRRDGVRLNTPLLELPRYLIHNVTTLEEFKTYLPQ